MKLTPFQEEGLSLLERFMDRGVMTKFNSFQGAGRSIIVAQLIKNHGGKYKIFVLHPGERAQWQRFGVTAEFWRGPESIGEAEIVVIGHSMLDATRTFIREAVEGSQAIGIEL